jgi:hypothetical protein
MAVLLFSTTVVVKSLVSLQTSTRVRGKNKHEVFEFLATPANWPTIVLSSWEVRGNAKDRLLKRRDVVAEIFGLPPVLPLSVKWQCVEANEKKGILDMRSPSGVDGLASDCRMLFEIREDQDKSSTVSVQLTMEYVPNNWLAQFAIPILTVDNALALKVLFPNALRSAGMTALNDFRSLMGVLYGVAGLAHLADCVLGSSQLLQASGSAGFYNLPLPGQCFALLWCAAGPVAFVASRKGVGDYGLIAYGAIEVTGAGFLDATAATSIATVDSVNPLLNAVAVQAIVGAAWLYASQKKDKPEPLSR